MKRDEFSNILVFIFERMSRKVWLKYNKSYGLQSGHVIKMVKIHRNITL